MYTWLSRLRRREGPSRNDAETKPIEITCKGNIYSAVLLPDGEHFVSGERDTGDIRHWRVADGQEVGSPMNARSSINDIAVSPDGTWLLSGSADGMLRVWDTQSHENVKEFRGHRGSWVCAVDVSPEATKVAGGSGEAILCVWSLSDGQQLLGPLKHEWTLAGVKFSPDGRLIATATWERESVRIYDSQDGRLVFDARVEVNSYFNQSLAWADDGKHIYALSKDGQVHCLDTSSGMMLSTWRIHSSNSPTCIALHKGNKFIAASAGSSVSFWDLATNRQVGSVIEHRTPIGSMNISKTHNIVLGGGHKITVRSLRGILPSHYTENVSSEEHQESHAGTTHDNAREYPQGYDNLDQTINSLRADFDALAEQTDSKMGRLLGSIHDLRHGLSAPPNIANRTGDSPDKIAESLETIVQQIRTQLAESLKKVEERDNLIQIRQLHVLLAEVEPHGREKDSVVQIFRTHEWKHICEALHAAGRTFDAVSYLLDIKYTMSKDEKANKFLSDWVTDFTSRCTAALESIGDDASNSGRHDEALAAYSGILSLSTSMANNVVVKWTSIMVRHKSVNEALDAAIEFGLPNLMVCRTICDLLEQDNRIAEAIAFFKRTIKELEAEMNTSDERSQWQLGFQRRCAEKLGKLAIAAMESHDYNAASEHLSTSLSLDGADHPNILVQRSKLRAMMGLWDGALDDANEAIKLNPSSHRGYERRHAALLCASRRREAAEAFEEMLSKMDQSPNQDIRKLRSQYTDARPVIRKIIRRTIHRTPSVLINTSTGHLYDKNQQAALFETLPIWNELVASMTRKLDHAHIGTAVKEFYQYVMLSHTWEEEEPLLPQVKNTSVYGLESSPTNLKLKEFCSIVRLLGYQWAWADTSCIDQKDNVVLQESLVAMFTWDRESSLTLVYLRDVSSDSDLPDGLRRSKWNTRGWTYQEYVAARTVRFYTRDWKPYLGLNLENHKDSLAIISEMQQATGMSAEEMSILRPGLDRVREKLFVASMRETTRTEDIAYSLLGIFNIAIPIIYGEGDRAVGRLLEHVLTGSGDVSILAWTGHAGSYNSCLPVDLTVYHELVPQHIPRLIETAEIDSIVSEFQPSFPTPSDAVKLYDALKALPAPFLVSSRLTLGGIICPVTELTCTTPPDPSTEVAVYHATTILFGDIEIKTSDDLTRIEDLSLIHPWIRPFLQQVSARRGGAPDTTTQALRLLARLRQPFGGLLLEQLSMDEYKRVATDSLIVAQILDDVPLTALINGADTIDVQ